MMECRLDNVVFRLGYAQTRRDARQLVSHAHFTVNGKKVNIPSYQVKAGDVIEVRESSRSSAKFAKLTGPEAPVVALPAWLERETGTLKGTVTRLPERSDIDYEVAEHLIVGAVLQVKPIGRARLLWAAGLSGFFWRIA